jgi:hypothetical protein
VTKSELFECHAVASGGLPPPVADHARHDQVGVVEGGAERVGQRVAQLAALVNGAGRLRRGVARNPAREGELLAQPLEPGEVPRHFGIQLAVGSFQVGVRHHARSAVARAGDEDQVEVVPPDDPVEVRVDEVEPRGRAPVSQQAGLDVVQRQRLPEQGVVQQVDLADGEIVGGPPVGVDRVQLGG